MGIFRAIFLALALGVAGREAKDRPGYTDGVSDEWERCERHNRPFGCHECGTRARLKPASKRKRWWQR